MFVKSYKLYYNYLIERVDFMRAGNWYTLDNTAKLMPSMTNNVNTNVFRLACTLKANVDATFIFIVLVCIF